MSKNRCSIGIIGFGRMGKLLCYYLSRHFDVYVAEEESKQLDSEIIAQNALPASFQDVCQKDIIIPAVPISQFEQVIEQMSFYLNPDATVIDLCSVKIFPISVMERLLPPTVNILGTHPMFGPDSAAHTLNGSKIVLCKVRIKEDIFKEIIQYLEKIKLQIIETTPDNHDREIAETLSFTHFLGRSLMRFGLDDYPIDTMGYQRLHKILLTVQNDSWQLFNDMIKYNKYAESTIQRFIHAMNQTAKQVDIE
ncbi:prephenate dehydrogenase/arogenate dehydrogenase family protein [Bacteriovoracaceae bacterium]|nr:prephenate dehydrogenase/arogenate dehydrogenase family protein [Bacteriovoracaceae bacterium]